MARRMIFNKNTIEAGILVMLLGQAHIFAPVGGAIVLAIARHYLKKWQQEGSPYVRPETDSKQVRASIYKLKRNKFITWEYDKKQNVVTLKLTKKGKEAFGKANFDQITIPRPASWDGQWRFFLFDVPEKRKGIRDVLRARLKSLGFFQFQKSVWIHPFDCEKEMRFICEYIGAVPYAMMFTAKIENDRTLRRYFLREGILLPHHLSILDKGLRY